MTLHIFLVESKLQYPKGYDDDSKVKATQTLYLFCRDDENKKIIKTIKGFYPYFYIEVDKKIPFELNRYIYKIDDKEYKNILDEKVVKIYTYNQYNIKSMLKILEANDIKSFEDDVNFIHRFFIDEKESLEKNGFDFRGNWRKLYIDIETTMEHGGVDVKTAPEKITCVGSYDSYSNIYYCHVWHPDYEKLKNIKVEGTEIFAYKNEEEMLKGWLDFYKKIDPDLLLGYNISEFDIPYIARRLDFLKIDKNKLCLNNVSGYKDGYREWALDRGEYLNPSINGLVLFDVFGYYMKINLNQIASYSLDRVSKAELGEGKIEVRNIGKCWKETPELFIQYNKKDTELTKRVEEKRELINFVDSMRAMVGINFDDFQYFSRMVDILLLRHAKQNNIVLPSKGKRVGKYIPKDEREARFEGGFVDAVPGIYKNVCGLDLSTLYPIVIKSMNISYETIRTDGSGEVKVGDYTYTLKKKGVLPSVIDEVLKLSAGYKKKRNESDVNSYEYFKYANLYEASKFIVLSLYGVQSTEIFRLYDIRNAENITRVGREIIKRSRALVEKEGHKNVLTDTDSTFVVLNEKFQTKEECVAEGLRLVEMLNKEYGEFAKAHGATTHYFNIKMEKFLSRMLVGKKKRYSGLQIWKESKDIDSGWLDKTKFTITGFEIVRSSTSGLGKKIQTDVIKMILEDKTKDEVEQYVREQYMNIINGEYDPEEIGLPTAINKSEYESNLPVVRASGWSNKYINTNYKVGSKNLLLYVIDPKKETDCVMFEYPYQWEEIKKMGIKLDIKKTIERDILMILTTVFEAANWDISKLRNEVDLKIKGQQTLF